MPERSTADAVRPAPSPASDHAHEGRAPGSAAPMAIGHRGAPRLARENTLPSFALAAEHGADWVELDVHLTGDGRLVVAHDPTLLRLWGVDRAIARMSLHEVEEATNGEARPLAEVLAANRINGVTSIVDVSTPAIAEAAAEAVAAEGTPLAGGAVGFTGDPGGLALVRRILPAATLLFSWESPELPAPGSAEGELLAACRPQYFNQDATFLTAEMVACLHRSGYLVSTYTVDTAPQIDGVLRMGVDAIISNDIDTLRSRIRAFASTADAVHHRKDPR